MSLLKHFIFNLIASGLALWGTDYFLDVLKIDSVDTKQYIKIILISVAVLSVINTVFKPILKMISLPFLFLTLGLFSLVINAICFFVLTLFIPEITVSIWWGYFIVPVILGFLNSLARTII